MTVPSTIASYYADATAAFVLSSELDYFIEPRTPLFQETLREPRASHFTLGSALGATVEAHLGDPNRQYDRERSFPPEFYSPDVCDEVVACLMRFQREYGSRAEGVSAKIDRYRSLLYRARGRSGHPQAVDLSRGPEYVSVSVLCRRILGR